MHLSEWAAEPLHFGVLKHSSNARKQGVFTCTHTLWWICYQMKMMKKNNYNKGFCLHVGKKTIKTFCFFYWANICVVMGPTSWIYILFGFGLFSSWYLELHDLEFERFSVSLGIVSRAEYRRECPFPSGRLTLNIGIWLADSWVLHSWSWAPSRFPIKRKRLSFLFFCCGSAVVE